MTHLKLEPYKCSGCRKTYRSFRGINRHQNRKTSRCKFCEIDFICKSLLKIHMKDQHGNMFECNLCTKSYDSSMKLSTHMHQHKMKLMRHQCESCEKSYIHKHSLKTHQTNERHGKMGSLEIETFNCDLCSKSYRSKTNFLSHQRGAHASKDLLTCRECNRSFLSRSGAILHYEYYHKNAENSYECDCCNKKNQV